MHITFLPFCVSELKTVFLHAEGINGATFSASYKSVIAKCGCSGVPILYGNPGSCKSEALKCGLSLFGAQNTHFYNNQTTPSFLFGALKQTTMPTGLDVINQKVQDTWKS